MSLTTSNSSVSFTQVPGAGPDLCGDQPTRRSRQPTSTINNPSPAGHHTGAASPVDGSVAGRPTGAALTVAASGSRTVCVRPLTCTAVPGCSSTVAFGSSAPSTLVPGGSTIAVPGA